MNDLASDLRRDVNLALHHIGAFAMQTDPVHATLFKVTHGLTQKAIPYVVCGGMALAAHGAVRATVDVDLIVTAEGLRAIHEQLDGHGYLPPFANSKNLKDTETGVRIEFLITGAFPGDGLPKPVAFPNPSEPQVAEEIQGVRYLSLPKLLELKLASGMTAPHRLKDLADVQALIEARQLPAAFAEQLHPYVRDKFTELWNQVHAPRPDFEEREPRS